MIMDGEWISVEPYAPWGLFRIHHFREAPKMVPKYSFPCAPSEYDQSSEPSPAQAPSST
jgi:hypothetical protein